MTRRKHFSVDARAILTWGRESIKDRTTAVIELVKNSYDAGASIVEVDIKASSSDPSVHSLIVRDNGEGMSELEVDDNWLRIGYSEKLENPKTSTGRRKTGEKGIGRISADRLGKLLELRTQRKREPAYGLRVDWSKFEKPGLELDEISLEPLDEVLFYIPKRSPIGSDETYGDPPSPDRNAPTCPGTELLIRSLRDQWTASSVRDLHQALSVLVPPFGDVGDGCVPKFVENRLAWLRAWTFDVTCYAANSSCWSMIAARCRYPSMRRMRICPNAISPHSSVTPAASVLNDPWVLVRRRNSRLRFSQWVRRAPRLPHRFGELVEGQQHQPRFLEAARHRRHQPRPLAHDVAVRGPRLAAVCRLHDAVPVSFQLVVGV